MAALLNQRLAQILSSRGRGAQQALADGLKEDKRRISNWVNDRADIHVDDVPRIAGALGVTICELYGVEEGHRASGTPETLRLAEELARAFQTPPERIEINVVPAGDWQLGESIETEDFKPTRGDRRTRRALEHLASMTDEQRERALAFLEQLHQEAK